MWLTIRMLCEVRQCVPTNTTYRQLIIVDGSLFKIELFILDKPAFWVEDDQICPGLPVYAKPTKVAWVTIGANFYSDEERKS